MTRITGTPSTPRTGITESLGVFAPAVVPPVSKGAQQLDQLLNAMSGIAEVAQGVDQLTAAQERYYSGQAVKHEEDGWPELEANILDPANTQYVIPEGMTAEEFADELLNQQAPAEGFKPGYVKTFRDRRRTRLIGTLVDRAEADKKEHRTQLLNLGITSLFGETDESVVDDAVNNLSSELGIDAGVLKSTAVAGMLQYIALRGGEGAEEAFEQTAALAPADIAITVERERQRLRQSMARDRQDGERLLADEVASIFLRVEDGKATLGEAREAVMDSDASPTVKLGFLDTIEQREIEADRTYLREATPQIYSQLLSDRRAGTFDNTLRMIDEDEKLTPEQKFRLTKVVESERATFLNEEVIAENRTIRDWRNQVLRWQGQGQSEETIRKALQGADIPGEIKQMLIAASEDRERRITSYERQERAFERSEMTRAEREQHDAAMDHVFNLVGRGQYTAAMDSVDGYIGEGLSPREAVQLKISISAMAQDESEQTLRIDIRDGEIDGMGAMAELDRREALSRMDPEWISIDRADHIRRQILEASREDARLARVNAIFSTALMDTGDGSSRGTIPILTSEDDDAINTALAQRGVVSVTTNPLNNSVVFNRITDPIRWAFHTELSNRVTTDAARVIRGGLDSEDLGQVTEGAMAYASLYLQAPHLAKGLELGDGPASVRARFIASRLERMGGNVIADNASLRQAVEMFGGELARITNSSVDIPRDNVLGMVLFNDVDYSSKYSSRDFNINVRATGKQDVRDSMMLTDFWSGFSWAEREAPWGIEVSEVPEQALSTYLRLLDEEYKFAVQITPDADEARKVAKQWALERTLKAHPPMVWNDTLYWTAQPGVTPTQNMPEILHREFTTGPRGGTEEEWDELLDNWIPVWDQTQQGYTFRHRVDPYRMYTWPTPDGSNEALVISMTPQPSAELAEMAQDAVERHGPRQAAFQPSNTPLGPEGTPAGEMTHSIPVLPVDQYNANFGSARYRDERPISRFSGERLGMDPGRQAFIERRESGFGASNMAKDDAQAEHDRRMADEAAARERYAQARQSVREGGEFRLPEEEQGEPIERSFDEMMDVYRGILRSRGLSRAEIDFTIAKTRRLRAAREQLKRFGMTDEDAQRLTDRAAENAKGPVDKDARDRARRANKGVLEFKRTRESNEFEYMDVVENQLREMRQFLESRGGMSQEQIDQLLDEARRRAMEN